MTQEEQAYIKNLHRKKMDLCEPRESNFDNPASMMFDPIFYMANNTIICRKYHYCVPQSYEDCDALLKFDQGTNCLKIFNLDRSSTVEYQGRTVT